MKKICKILALLCSVMMLGSTLASCDILQGVLDNLHPPVESSQSNSNSSSTKPAPKPEPEPEPEDDKSALYSYYPIISDVMPTISINTPDGDNSWATKYKRDDKLNDRIDYVDATVSVSDCEEEYQITDAEAEVKVRGNYTLEYSKKPIRIKFKKKSKCNLLGLHDGEEYRNWVLLADWKDLSMTNNSLAFYLGNTILGSDGYYCTDFRNVQVELNGQYWGVYLLVEQQEAKDGRTSVPEVEEDYTGTDIGYLFEYDSYYTTEQQMPNGAGDPTFTMNYAGGPGRNNGYTVKNDIYDNGQLTFLKNYMDNAYKIIYQATYYNTFYKFNNDYSGIVSANYQSSKEAVDAVLDIQSLVDTYILNELACDLDVDWSSFYLSLNMTAEGNKKITFEAPWDWDSCFGIVNGVCNNAQGLYAASRNNPWFKLVTGCDWFQDMVCEKWAELKKYGVLDNALKLIKQEKETYKPYYIGNYNKWSERINNGNGEVIAELNNYKDINTAQGLASDYLTRWFTKRIAYLDSQWTKIEVDENLPANAQVYKYEAENAVLGGGFENKNPIRVNRSYASNNSYIGDVAAGNTVTFTVTAAEATTVYLYAGVSKRSMQGTFGEWFSITVNGKPLLLPIRTIPAISNGEEEWHTFIPIKLAPTEFVKGENTIVFTAGSTSSNFDYIEIYSAEKLS